MSEIISSKDIQPVVIQVASAEDAATLARIETGIRTAAQNVVQGYLTIGSYLNEAKGRKIVPHGQWEDWVLYNTGLSLRQAAGAGGLCGHDCRLGGWCTGGAGQLRGRAVCDGR